MRRTRMMLASALAGTLAWAGPAAAEGTGADRQGQRSQMEQSDTGRQSQTGQSDTERQSQTGQSEAQPEMAQGAQQGQEQRQAKASVVGTVQSVDGDTLSLKNKLGETHEFSLDDDTRFTRGGRTIAKDQISEGDEVRAAFTGDEGNLEATEIILMRSGKGSSSTEASSTGSSSTGSSSKAGSEGQGSSGGAQQDPGTAPPQGSQKQQ